MVSCKNKSEEEQLEELVEKMGEAKTEEEATKIAEKIEKLEQRANKSSKEIIVKIGEPFTFWQHGTVPADPQKKSEFWMTFKDPVVGEFFPYEPEFVEFIRGHRVRAKRTPADQGKKYFGIIAKIENSGPRGSSPQWDMEVKVDKGFIYRLGATGIVDDPEKDFPQEIYTLEPRKTGWLRLWCQIPEDTYPIEVFGKLGEGYFGASGYIKFRLKLTQFEEHIGEKGKEGNSSQLQFPLRGEWEPLRSFGVWSSDWFGRHLGEDIERNPNIPVFPLGDGIVKFAQYQPKVGIGYGIIIEHNFKGEYLCSVYYHMREPKANEIIKVGQTATLDKPIGYISDDPKDHLSIPHLHFGIRKGKYMFGRDPRTNRWFYPGYTTIYNDQNIRQINQEDPIHNEIIKEWLEPTKFININSAILSLELESANTKAFFDQVEEDKQRYLAKPEDVDSRDKGSLSHQKQQEQNETIAKSATLYFKELSEQDTKEAERLLNVAVPGRSNGRLPTTGFILMVTNCREIIKRWPDSCYAYRSKQILSDIPPRFRERYRISEEELDLSKFKSQRPGTKAFTVKNTESKN